MLLLPQESFIEARPLELSLCLLHLALRSGRRRRVVKEIKLTPLLLSQGCKGNMFLLQPKRDTRRETISSTWQKRRKPNKGISSWQQLETGEMTMQVGTGHIVSAIVVGELRLCLHKSFLLLEENVYVVPDLERNLISVKCLLE
ncbi:hypothetical protein IC575_002158 [Cucumis melo]